MPKQNTIHREVTLNPATLNHGHEHATPNTKTETLIPNLGQGLQYGTRRDLCRTAQNLNNRSTLRWSLDFIFHLLVHLLQPLHVTISLLYTLSLLRSLRLAEFIEGAGRLRGNAKAQR